jgi:hypothetical protein
VREPLLWACPCSRGTSFSTRHGTWSRRFVSMFRVRHRVISQSHYVCLTVTASDSLACDAVLADRTGQWDGMN